MTTKALRPVFVVGSGANALNLLDHASCVLASAERLADLVGEEDPTNGTHGVGYLIEIAHAAVNAARNLILKECAED